MEQRDLENLLADYHRLFYKVLRRCSIFPGQADYEDYLQELRVLFFLKAQQYDSRGLFEAEVNTSYLFRYLMWYVVDQKRKLQPEISPIEELEGLMKVDEKGYQTVEMQELFAYFYQSLQPKEQKKLTSLLTDKNLSRQNRSNYRRYFRKHFDLFFKKL